MDLKLQINYQTLFRRTLDMYKKCWTDVNVPWDYEIREIQGAPQEWVIEVLGGVKIKTVIIRIDLRNTDIDKLWEELLIMLLVAGWAKTYESTIENLRTGIIKMDNPAHSQNPLSPTECFKKA